MDEIIKARSRKKNSKNYFNEETEEAIVAYNSTDDIEKKNFIYERYLHYPFFKLTQNIIHTFKFHHTDVDNLEHLQQELIIFLLSKIHLFDPSKGTKAYSYLGTIVKRWLIVYNKKNYDNLKNNIPLDSLVEISNKNNLIINSYNNKNITEIVEEVEYDLDEEHENPLSVFMDEFIEYCYQHLNTLFPKKQEAKIADAILIIFKKRNMIPIFHKKALYIHIKEIIDVKTPKITKVILVLKKIFKTKYSEYQESKDIYF